MKHWIIIILLYIGQIIGFYLLLATIGLIWYDWQTIIHSESFNAVYFMIFSWWVPIPACIQYYEEYLE